MPRNLYDTDEKGFLARVAELGAIAEAYDASPHATADSACVDAAIAAATELLGDLAAMRKRIRRGIEFRRILGRPSDWREADAAAAMAEERPAHVPPGRSGG